MQSLHQISWTPAMAVVVVAVATATTGQQRFAVLPGTMTWPEATERCARHGLVLAPAAASPVDLSDARAMLTRDGVNKRLWIDGQRSSRRCSCDWDFGPAAEDAVATLAVFETSRLAKNECLTLTAPDQVGYADCSHYQVSHANGAEMLATPSHTRQAGALCARPPPTLPPTMTAKTQPTSQRQPRPRRPQLDGGGGEDDWPDADGSTVSTRSGAWLPGLLAALLVCFLVIAGLLAVIAGQRSAYRARVRHAQPLEEAVGCRANAAGGGNVNSGHIDVGGSRSNKGSSCSCDMTASSVSKISTLTSVKSAGSGVVSGVVRSASANLGAAHHAKPPQLQQPPQQPPQQQQVIQNPGIHIDEGTGEMASLYDVCVGQLASGVTAESSEATIMMAAEQ